MSGLEFDTNGFEGMDLMLWDVQTRFDDDVDTLLIIKLSLVFKRPLFSRSIYAHMNNSLG